MKITIFFLFLPFCLLSAQKNDYNWVIKGGAGGDPVYDIKTILFDFSQNPTNISKKNIGFYSVLSGNTSFSDNLGNLSFFTNGIDVFDKTFDLMENGGNVSSLYSTVNADSFVDWNGIRTQAIFKPLSIDTAFLFTVGGLIQVQNAVISQHLFLTEISTKMNNGKGKVILKNKALIKNDSLEEFSLIQHANGRDWWLIIPKNFSNIYYRFLIQPDKIDGPFIQNIGPDVVLNFSSKRFSQQGEKYAVSTTFGLNNSYQGLFLYDFDRCTGLFVNEKFIPLEEYKSFSETIPICFSPSGKVLYCGISNVDGIEYSGWLIQFEIDANDIKSTIDTVGGGIYDPVIDYNPFVYGILTLAPDGRIYQQCYLHTYNVIDFPDRKGDLCRFRSNVRYGGNPPIGANDNMPAFPNYRLGPMDGGSCDTLGLNNHPVAWFRWDFEDTLQKRMCSFTDLSYYEPATWHWDFGDGSQSTAMNPFHVYQNDGVYQVCLTVCNQYLCDTLCQTVYIGVSATNTPKLMDNLVIYPNPASTELFISLPNFTGFEKNTLQIINPLGQLLETQTFAGGQTTLDISNLPAGLVFVQIFEKGKIKAVGKVVILH